MNLGRASILLGAGTVVSRLTGFLRTVVLVSAIGATTEAGNAFAIANQLPNNIYAVIQAGLLTAVLVPQIVRAARHPDGGSAFVSKILTLGTLVLLGITALAVVLAPWLVTLYAPEFPPHQQALATAFAYWCMPQILFYGLYSLLGETLNARRVFGPFTWAPIINNVVSIGGFAAFIALFGLTGAVENWTPTMVALLAGTATLGIAIQAVILVFFWKKTGLSVRPDFQWRGIGLRHIGRLAGWTFLMVIAGQLAGLVQSRILSEVNREFAGVFVSQNAWLLFMLPYSIIAVSIGTPYFTQLSEHAAAGRHEALRTDIATSLRTVGLFIVAATAALAAAAVPASRIFTNSAAEADDAALVLLCYLAGLLPLSVLFIVQRTFYIYNDTRTPFFFTLVQGALVVVTALIASWTLPVEFLAAGIALGQSFAGIVQMVLAIILLRRKLGGLRVLSWLPAFGRYVVAAIPAGLAGWAVFRLLGGEEGWTVSSELFGALGAAVIGTASLMVYLGVLALLRAPELGPALSMVKRFLPGQR
ncbi:murein biosynthesis integral membrane protein MurJ [Microbacterium koreense]|uniref:Murein biosynthesis integral membrane protein MurJ n=1 Tax=Microbacterium koreense TaxID=323761 RepID=A0ABW2ZNH9_9MICO